MKLLSVNVGLPRELEWKGKVVRTSIFKVPVTGQVRVAKLNVEGDQQSDLTVHGGIDKAVYAYPSEHFAFWSTELPGMDLPWGVFGENFTTAGLLEETFHIGDRLRIGSAEFMVTQPRMPCFKLDIRFNRSDMVKRFLQSGRTGFYFAVLKEGEVAAGESTFGNAFGIRTIDNSATLKASRLWIASVLRTMAVFRKGTEMGSDYA